MERSLKHDVIIVRSKKEVSTSAVCSYFLVLLCLSVSLLMFFFVIFNDVIIVRTKTEVSTSAVGVWEKGVWVCGNRFAL